MYNVVSVEVIMFLLIAAFFNDVMCVTVSTQLDYIQLTRMFLNEKLVITVVKPAIQFHP